MSNLRTTWTAVVLALLLITSFLVTLATVPGTVSAYNVHDPIYIDGDADFTSANGVTDGSGTESDPYIIEGWEIEASFADGIWLNGTNAYFIIRNCYVHDGGIYHHGIHIHWCSNGTVTGNVCSNNTSGIHISSSSNNILGNNDCSSNGDYGMYLSSSNNNTLSYNDCSSNGFCGIRLDSSSNNTLSYNDCSSNGYCGIRLDSSSNNNALSGNICSLNDNHGVDLVSSGSNTLSGNDCSSNGQIGILLHSSSNNILSGNSCKSSSYDGMMLLESANNTLSGNTCSSNGRHGVYLYWSCGNMLGYNTCSNNDIGIRLYSSSNNTISGGSCSDNGNGMMLLLSSSNTLSDNICSSNDEGMFLSSSSNNTLTNNICRFNSFYGIVLASSSDNTLSGNNCSSHNNYGIFLDSSGSNTVISNTCSNNAKGIKLQSSSDNVLTDNDCLFNNDGVFLYSSNNNILVNNNCSSNPFFGMCLSSSSNNTLSDNNCNSNDYGILLSWSSNNTLSDNYASLNGVFGIWLANSTETTVYHSVFFDNVVSHACDNKGSENLWNASYPIGGNYWDNYSGVDELSGPNQDQPGSDGIGDTPYVIDTDSVDCYPLMEPPNTPPTASFTVSHSTGYVNAVYSVDASSSSDEEDDLSELDVRWDWESDGVWDTSWSLVKTATHQYSAEGTYTITLEVRDTEGLTDSTTRVVTVIHDDVPPVADAGSDQTVTVGGEVTFDGSGSTDNLGIENYTWALSYADEVRKLYGVGPKFRFDIAGTYVVTLTVKDAYGGTDEDTVTITVEEEEDEKSFIEAYGLPLGIVAALAVIALVLFFVLKGRKGGKAPTSLEKAPAT